ncbi:MAG TPA: hypothetical protein VEH27_00355 [Methylomirabilota bacterium]|nr:hypothetical protein [Methylomirabilota bacterium]
MNWVLKIGRAAGRLFGRRRDDALSRSDLVSIYMAQTNGRQIYKGGVQQNRDRRNGRSLHDRERA